MLVIKVLSRARFGVAVLGVAAALVGACGDDDAPITDVSPDASTRADATTDSAVPGEDASSNADAEADAEADAGADADAGAEAGEGGVDAADAGLTGYPAVVVTDSPVAYYRLGEAAGPTAVNASAGGSPFNAVYNGFAAAQFGKTGLIANDANTAVSCATGTSLTVPLNAGTAALKLGAAFTVEAWVTLDSATGTRAIVSTKGAGPDGFSFGVNASGNLFLACHGKFNFGSTLAMPTDGTTHYVAVVFDGSTTSTFYLDATTQAVTSPPITITYTTSSNMAICKFGDGQLFEWIGVVDELALFPSALPAARITAHRAAGLP